MALLIIREISRGLDYAHNYGGLNLVHRDIAPPNILLSWHGEVKITDFGLARSTLKSEKTAPGIVYGRIAYLAPEQARGEQADKRTDVYAVGVILWELLTGRPLHETTDEAVKNLEMARHPRVEAPSHFSRGIAPTLDAVVMKALAPKRDDRYGNADELRRGVSEELARVAPATDSSRLSSWLSELFEEEVKSEAQEFERLLREELPRLRARHTFQIEASPRPQVVRAQSLDLRIAGVDRPDALKPASKPPLPPPPPAPVPEHELDEPTTAAGRRSPDLPGMRGSPERPPAKPTVASPASAVRATRGAPARGQVAAQFDDDGETRIQPPRSAGESGRARVAVASARNPEPELEAEDAIEAEHIVGEIIDGRYRVERLLGTGGMGAVYEAEHIEIGKKVALKVLHPQFSRQADLVQRFRREARAASKVGHPNIVDVTDSGTTEAGDAYFVMERLDGTDLADVLRNERRIAIDRTVGIGAQICRALHAAHQAGIIHRDLKPENIFLVARDGQPDFVKVLDFGIAKSDGPTTQAPRRLTTPGIAMGTPEYMAPEQAAGKPVDGRVDIYSVGAILYEMLLGEPPHAGANVMDILAKKATEAPQPIRPRNKAVPEPLERVILACLEREPARRPQTMAALEYELNKCLKGRGSAVASVLGIKATEENVWPEEITRSAGGFEGTFTGVTTVAGQRVAGMGTAATIPGVMPRLSPNAGEQGLAGLLEPGSAANSAPGAVPLDTPTPYAAQQSSSVAQSTLPAPPRPSARARVLGVLGGIVFLGVAGYLLFRQVYQPTIAPVVAKADTTTKSTNAVAPGPDPSAHPDEEPLVPTATADLAVKAKASSTTSGEEHLSEAEIARLLEWARRTAEGGRIIAPPNDNLKDLLDRIERASPGNKDASELRGKTSALLGRRGALALKKMRLEEAEDAFRTLVILKPDDDWSKERLARTLAIRADRSLERRRYPAAANDAMHALELQPDDVLARLVLAEAQLATGKRELAAEEFKRVLELRPTNKRAKVGLANALAPPPKRAGNKPPPKKKR